MARHVLVREDAEALLSRPDTKSGQLQRACLALLAEHERAGAVPTSIRFLFYELEGRGVVPKSYGPNIKRKPSQDVSDALMHLRVHGLVPWDHLVDETRSLTNGRTAASIGDYLVDTVALARIDRWAGEPAPLILCESRSLAGVLDELAYQYAAPIAATNGQSGGFLVTDLVPLLTDPRRRVLYLGDFDWCGTQIETATRRTLTEHSGREFTADTWERIALTAEQVEHYQLAVIQKADNRYRPVRWHDAVETEALSQTVIVDLVQARLDELMPEPLADVLVREQRQRAHAAEVLRGASWT